MSKVDPSGMRRLNAVSTMRTIHDAGPLTMAALQQKTGLSRRTLELILGQLTEQGWIKEQPPEDSDERSAGRPARSFEFDFQAAYVLAIQLDVDTVAVLLSDLSGLPVAETHRATPVTLSRAERLDTVRSCVDAVLAEAQVAQSAVMAVTLSTPGVVRDSGEVDLPLSIPEWTNFSLSSSLHEYFDCPVYVENDAKLAAIGEKWAGTGDDVENFVWVRADGIRIGIGIVINGELYRGRDGAAGEVVWAHTLGFGVVSGHVMSGLSDPGHPRYAEAVDTVDRARLGDPEALANIRTLAEGLAPGLTTLAWILAPDEIIIGGSLGRISDVLIPELEDIFSRDDHPLASTILGSRLGDRAMLLGGTRKSLDQVADLLFNGSDIPATPTLRHGSPQPTSEETAS